MFKTTLVGCFNVEEDFTTHFYGDCNEKMFRIPMNEINHTGMP